MSAATVQNTGPLQTYYSPPITIVLTFIFLLVFFFGLFSLFFCKFFVQNLLYMLHLSHTPTGTPVTPATASAGNACPPPAGLDPSIINSFPTFAYSSIKDFRKEKYGLECAICLYEFEDQSILRLLIKCSHVFHRDCIDLWLKTNTSCPVCRQSLDMQEKSPASARNSIDNINNENYGSLEGSTISINISDHDEDGRGTKQIEGQPNKVQGFFARSKSTGHSIVRISRERKEERESDEDRFRLILPDLVKAKFIIGQNLTRSCNTFGEYKSRTCTGHGGFAEK